MMPIAPKKIDVINPEQIKMIFRRRMRLHYKNTMESIRIILNYWVIYLYAFIGLLAAVVVLFTIIIQEKETIYSEVYLIYLGAIYYIIATQFSMKYFLHPADLIHFKQAQEIILKLRKYAVIHAIFYQLFNWTYIFLLLATFYFNLSSHNVIHYVLLYFFSVSFSLAASMIRKESKFNLREKSRSVYFILYICLTIVFLVWFITIFCFADLLYIFIGIIINLFIFIYAYNWGIDFVIPTLNDLVQHDNRINMISATIVGNLSEQNFTIRSHQSKSYFLSSKHHFLNHTYKKFVLGDVLIKHLLRTQSYTIMMIYLYAVSGLGLFMIQDLLQFFVLALVTLYISFLIHKQHIEYFYAHTLMTSNVKQGFKKRLFDVKYTLLFTLPVLFIMFIVFVISSY